MLSLRIILSLFLIFTEVLTEEAPEIKEEESVLVLTEKNFEYAVTNNKYVLVEFCKYCTSLFTLCVSLGTTELPLTRLW